jgi:hypothetical protein
MPSPIPLDRPPKMLNIKGTKTPAGRCPIAHSARDPEDLEHDFTTPGKIGNLECPFAKMAPNGLPATPNSHDPIAAEFHSDEKSVTSAGGLGKCPIRFLDKHSPEEVAQYFENHKHEIPRSHEVCVRRYQKNEDSVRALDAKYGNLVNMIQGLGVKHKQYLPHGNEETNSNGAVERWADGVSSKAELPQQEQHEEPRLSNFERPLRDVRVGESPSRPWGISVPVDKAIPASAMASEGNQTQQPTTSASPPSGPTQSLPPQNMHTKPEQATATKESAKREEPSSAPPPQIIFNGPVFFGYSAEDVAKLLSNFNVNGLYPPGS